MQRAKRAWSMEESSLQFMCLGALIKQRASTVVVAVFGQGTPGGEVRFSSRPNTICQIQGFGRLDPRLLFQINPQLTMYSIWGT